MQAHFDSSPNLELTSHEVAELRYRAMLRAQAREQRPPLESVPVLYDLANLCAVKGRLGEAERLYRDSLDILAAEGCAETAEAVGIAARLATILVWMDRAKEAEALLAASTRGRRH